MSKTSLLFAPLVGGVALVACSKTSSPVTCGPDSVAVVNAEAVTVTNYEAAWFYGALDPVPLGLYAVADVPVGSRVDQSTAAAAAVAAAAGRYFPDTCTTATASGNVVTFTLDTCSGPLGLAGTSGIATATLNVVSNSVQVQLAGNDISANGATLNLATSGTLTATASGQKTLQANSQTSGTGLDGNSITHTGVYTMVWPTGTSCATIDGTLSGIGSGDDAGTTTTQITNYVACTDKCPQSGMAVSSFNGGSVTLAFNGGTNAQCTSSIGTSASIPLNCP